MTWKTFRFVIAVAAGMVVVVGALLLAFTPVSRDLTHWLAGSDWADMNGAARTAAEGQVRSAVLQVIAAVGASIALLYTARTYRLSRRGQVTDRFTKALERLSADESYVRLGGVFAMEQIVQDAPEQGVHAARVLNAYVRRRANPADRSGGLEAAKLPKDPEETVTEALRVLTTARPWWRSEADRPQVDLTKLHLAGAQLTSASLRGALLGGTTLLGAELAKADLSGADLSKANLSGANLEGADLSDAGLDEADLSEARGLEVRQLLRARSLRGCRLPPGVSSNAEVAGRAAD
ncbi:pentapeptide repeat-containing protein [Kitasatospora cineracea]|uniref:Pentapeptide repeat protein n=1 Tax=Kitasatospora cineracea TaxID=88074 RepID=A0A8G1UH33_9ACTN|nr:pentapeptide repeat-containing protein [Kitasatospora cineracea]ROR38181.1 pentapeptide repeat protein [Kitasatospora cineracea]